MRALPVWVEALVVLGVTLGPFVVASNASAWESSAEAAGPDLVFSDGAVLELVRDEILLAAAALLVLLVRGRSLTEFGWRISLRLTLLGLGLVAASYAAVMGLHLALAEMLGASVLAGTEMASDVGWLAAIAVVLVNPIYEELFAGGYLLATVEARRGPVLAVAAGTALRVAYHTYQGVPGVLTNVVIGVLFGVAYLKTRQLWPLILAHAVLDALGLWALS